MRGLVEISDEAVQTRLREARVARLATVGADRRPHVVPVCFAYDGHVFYSALDLKPKRVPPEQLARVRHIQAQPNVVVLIDHYEEDWAQLWYVMVRGTAKLLSPVDAKEELSKAHQMLRAKYPQYRGSFLPEDAPIIRIVPRQITCWGKL
jgi:PPOX class probable F420-dependent enzyme